MAGFPYVLAPNHRRFMKVITVYTDGACSGNPGPGGWAAVLAHGERERVLSGSDPHTTNNRMELKAAIEALRALREPCAVHLHTDSTYLEKAFNDGWVDNWVRRGWKTAGKKPVENRDLWEQLLEAAAPHRVTWIKVKGHSDDPMNNRVDELAVAALKAARHG
jgi:ribonuclease HI